jgi:glycosyltransferase involved in cell wall biosynthesis
MAKDSKTPITFHGWLDRDDPKFRELYETSAIFVFPSEMENFPTVLLEAMSAGCAIITSTAGGCPEVVGEAGVLVKPQNAKDIGKAIVGLIQLPEKRAKLSEAALARAQQFTWQSIANHYLELYHTMANTQTR